MTYNDVYPWQIKQLTTIINATKNLKLHHALLLNGKKYIGKKNFALQLSSSILCQNANDDNLACGSCDACRQFHNLSHPDFHMIETVDNKSIGIAQIRTLNEKIAKKPLYGGYQIMLLSFVNITTEATNAFLKSLEEPSPQTILILLCDNKYKILPTILSRCLCVNVQTPNQQDLINNYGIEYQNIFKLFFYRPILIEKAIMDSLFSEVRIDFLNTLFKLINNKNSLDDITKHSQDEVLQGIILDILTSIVVDVIMLQQNINKKQLTNIDFEVALINIKDKFSNKKLLDFITYLKYIKSISSEGLNVETLYREIFARLLLCKY
jgi:DNA polymerase III subunit delta'